MDHDLSAADRAFRDDVEGGRTAPAQFDHRAHVRLVYCYLVENDVDAAAARMGATLQAFLARHGIARAKYDEALTRAWTGAVRHAMDRSRRCASAEEFIARNAWVLDKTTVSAATTNGRGNSGL